MRCGGGGSGGSGRRRLRLGQQGGTPSPGWKEEWVGLGWRTDGHKDELVQCTYSVGQRQTLFTLRSPLPSLATDLCCKLDEEPEGVPREDAHEVPVSHLDLHQRERGRGRRLDEQAEGGLLEDTVVARGL